MTPTPADETEGLALFEALLAEERRALADIFGPLPA